VLGEVIGEDFKQGSFTVFAEPRGSKWRLDPYYNLDLRIEKKFQFSSRFGLRVAADLFNILNAHTMIETLTTTGTEPGFMKPSRIVPPRRVQLTVRFSF
jgi:hypothetical protein